MRVLLISSNNECLPSPVSPLGILYLAEVLRKKNIKVRVLDLCFSENFKKDIVSAIESFYPDTIGISIRNIDNLSYPNFISYIPNIKIIISIINEKSSVPIILGGSGFSLFPEQILNLLGVNIGVIGEGEKSFIKILEKIKNNCYDFSGIQNVIWKSSNKIYKNEITFSSNNNFVIRRDLIDNDAYSKYGGMGNIQTKKGCGFQCLYCTYPLLEGKEYRLRKPEIVAEELEYAYKKYNIEHFFFVDNIFNVPENHAFQVCKSIIKKKINVTWSCFASINSMSKDLLNLMKKAGCNNIEFGTDALSDKVLNNLKKAFCIEDIYNVSKICKEVNIKFAHYIMFGGPGEDEETLGQAFDNIQSLESTAIIAMVGIRIYPGTELEKLAYKEGLISKGCNLLEPYFYLTPKIKTDILLKKVSEFAANNSKCIIPGLGIRSSEEMFKALRKFYKQGPLWGYLE